MATLQTVLPFKLAATDESLTSHGGLALVGEYLRAMGVADLIDHELPHPGSAAGYKPSAHVLPLILMLAGGGRTLEDLRVLRNDEGLRALVQLGDMPSSDATGDWLRRMPDHLPLETIEHEAPCVCPNCGGEKFGKIGADEREVLEYVPSHFKRVLHVRPKMSCRACETIVQAPMPSLPIEKGRPGPALLAHVIVSKFCDHLPLHRQSEIYARNGVAIDRSTMAGWVGFMTAYLEHVGAAIGRHVRAGASIHADDTRVPVLDPGRGKTKTGRLWVAVRDARPFGSTAPPAAFYLYSPDRKSAHAKELLDPCRGFLHADGYAGFGDLYLPDPKTGEPRLVEVACWAHARRHIYEVYLDTDSPAAREALDTIARLFTIEAEIRTRSTASTSCCPGIGRRPKAPFRHFERTRGRRPTLTLAWRVMSLLANGASLAEDEEQFAFHRVDDHRQGRH
jgi:transposase